MELLQRVKNMGIRAKLQAGFFGIIGLLAILLMIFINLAIMPRFYEELTKRGISMSKELAADISGYMMVENSTGLQLHIIETMRQDEDIKYIFVTDDKGATYAHTFEGGFPTDLNSVHPMRGDEPHSLLHLNTESGRVIDIAVPVMKGALGYLHLGLSEEPIRRKTVGIMVSLGLILVFVSAAGVLLVRLLATKITRPLTELVAAAQEIGMGELSGRVHIHAHDEVGRLGAVFNHMAENLSKTLVSREELQSAYSFVTTVLDSMSDSISIINVSDHRIVSVNQSFMKEYGLKSADEAIGKTCYEVTHNVLAPCGPPHDVCPLEELLASGSPAVVEHRHFGGNGAVHYVEVHAAPVLDKKGEISKIVHLSRDITERKRSEQRVRESEERFRSLFDSSLDGIYWTDSEGNFTLINQAGARILGHMSPLEIIGRPAENYWMSPAEREIFLSDILRDGSVKDYPMRARKPDGTLVELEATSAVILDDQGAFCGLRGILRDVSDRKKTDTAIQRQQEELLKNHETLQNLFSQVERIKREWELSLDCTNAMFMLVDQTGSIRRCNRMLKTMVNREYAEIIGRDWAELFAESGLINDQMADEKYGSSVELYHQPSFRWFVMNSYEYLDSKFGITGNVITLHDITELKNIAAALEITSREVENNNQKLSSALEGLDYLIHQVTKNRDFSVRFENPNIPVCYQLKNCTRTDCPCHDVPGGSRCWQAAGTFCGGRIQGAFACKLENCTDCEVFKLATADPVYQIGESFNNMMHILEQQHNELEQAYNDLKVAQSQVTQQEKMASIGQLAAGVAHEINNPTGFIMSNLGSLQRYILKIEEFLKIQQEALGGLPQEVLSEIAAKRKSLKVDFILEDLGGLIRESLDGAERIKKIVQDLKSFSRVDEAEQKVADINAGIESTLNIVWNEIKYKATVNKEYGQLPQIKCNPGQLNQVFMNILVNAAHAIEKQGEIGIKTWEADGRIHVLISDTGSGIPADKLNRIFEPFYTTKEVGKGTGLGLSIAYDIVKKHHGEINVESEVGKGTVFTVIIPVREEV